MSKQTDKPLGIYLESTRNMHSRPSRRVWRWFIPLVVLIAMGYFAAHKLREWKRIRPLLGHHAEVARTPLSAPAEVPPPQAAPEPIIEPAATAAPKPAAPEPAAPEPKAASASAAVEPLPAEVTLLESVSLEVKREGNVAGVVYLQPGQRVVPISVHGDTMSIAWGDAVGIIPIGSTDYGKQRTGPETGTEKAR